MKISFDARYVLHNLQLFDGETDTLHRGARIVVDRGRILAVDASPDPFWQAGFTLVDLQGMTVLPGLIDCHVHITSPFMTRITSRSIASMEPQICRNARVCVEAGITTVRDAGGIPRRLEGLAAAIRSFDLMGPRIIRSNAAIAPSGGYPDRFPAPKRLFTSLLGGSPVTRVASARQADSAVTEQVRMGADWIKVCLQHRSTLSGGGVLPVFDAETVRSITRAARRCAKPVCCHVAWLDDLRCAMSMGVRTVEHSPLEPIPDETAMEFASRDLVLNPTLTCLDLGSESLREHIREIVLGQGETYLEPEPLRQVRSSLDQFQTPRLPLPGGRAGRDRPMDLDLYARAYPHALSNVVRVLHAGGTVGVASGAGGLPFALFGVFYREELRRLRHLGLSPFQVLSAATAGNARILGMHDRIGAVRPGMEADLIAVPGNPLEDLDALAAISMVMVRGRIVKGDPRHPHLMSILTSFP
ncbi:MAG TPA: amidohydrolase family protein [Deltaproteobacteria bacterium]|nr:amidohydrolase family protein [Deltaproteobacteria bacterium]HQI82021.1 amidohydrolase family protein [Deltaproteobacteria bacterium]